SSRSACQSIRVDAVMKCCDAVTKWVVTVSCRVGDTVSRLCEHKSSRVLVLTSKVAELKKHKWELPKEFASILNAHNKGIPSTGKSTASYAKGEKKTNPVTEYAELAYLVDLMGIDMVEEYHKKKLLYNKYRDKMLKRKKSPLITNCEVITKKGPITLKIYREDGSEEVISNLKTRLDQLTQTEQELKIDLNKPLKEQDLLNELKELANKKRKRTGDFSDKPRALYLSNKLNRTAEAKASVLVK
ncbi:hypothetical protein Tco_1228851, partial [Tanacetum coccineum]